MRARLATFQLLFVLLGLTCVHAYGGAHNSNPYADASSGGSEKTEGGTAELPGGKKEENLKSVTEGLLGKEELSEALGGEEFDPNNGAHIQAVKQLIQLKIRDAKTPEALAELQKNLEKMEKQKQMTPALKQMLEEKKDTIARKTRSLTNPGSRTTGSSAAYNEPTPARLPIERSTYSSSAASIPSPKIEHHEVPTTPASPTFSSNLSSLAVQTAPNSSMMGAALVPDHLAAQSNAQSPSFNLSSALSPKAEGSTQNAKPQIDISSPAIPSRNTSAIAHSVDTKVETPHGPSSPPSTPQDTLSKNALDSQSGGGGGGGSGGGEEGGGGKNSATPSAGAAAGGGSKPQSEDSPTPTLAKVEPLNTGALQSIQGGTNPDLSKTLTPPPITPSKSPLDANAGATTDASARSTAQPPTPRGERTEAVGVTRLAQEPEKEKYSTTLDPAAKPPVAPSDKPANTGVESPKISGSARELAQDGGRKSKGDLFEKAKMDSDFAETKPEEKVTDDKTGRGIAKGNQKKNSSGTRTEPTELGNGENAFTSDADNSGIVNLEISESAIQMPSEGKPGDVVEMVRNQSNVAMAQEAKKIEAQALTKLETIRLMEEITSRTSRGIATTPPVDAKAIVGKAMENRRKMFRAFMPASKKKSPVRKVSTTPKKTAAKRK